MANEIKDNLSAAMLETRPNSTATLLGNANSAKHDKKPSTLKASENKIRAVLRARLGEEVYSSWFSSMEFEA